MNMNFYKYVGIENKLVKNLTHVKEIENVYFKEPYDILNPTVKLNLTTNYTEYFNGVNYCNLRSSNTDLFYFIRNITQETNNIIELQLELDVLYTYRDFIKVNIQNGNGIVVRSGAINSGGGQPLEDKNIKIGGRTSENQTILEFESPLTWDNPYFLLAVVGSYGVFNDTE